MGKSCEFFNFRGYFYMYKGVGGGCRSIFVYISCTGPKNHFVTNPMQFSLVLTELYAFLI